MKKSLLIIVLFFSGALIKLHAQNTSLVDSSETRLLLDTGKTYAMPDIKKSMGWTYFSTKAFSMQLGFVGLIDYSAFFQNDKSIEQVGQQKDQFDLRSVRFMARGKILFKNPWSYLISVEYKGFDRTDDQNAFGFTDLMLTITVGKIGNFTIGKIKETFIYEMVGDAANLPQSERILSPFFISRNTGIRWDKTALNDRMMFSAGAFNNFASSDTTLKGGATEFTGRVTGLPIYDEANKTFLHLAFSARYLEAQGGVLRYKGKDESNVTSNYVDTKNFAANHSWSFGFEELYSVKSFALLGEYVVSNANTLTGNQTFIGWYLTGSWVIGGDQRPYDKKAGYARRVRPTGKGGAWEIVTRVSKLDLNSRDIKGGNLVKLFGGVSWWASQRWRLTAGYGYGDLDKDNIRHGITNSIITRLQWIY